MSQNHVTIYSTTWCPFCQRLRAALDKAGTPYNNIDVENDTDAAAWVMSVNNGNRVVPTVKYSDGTYATNPPATDVQRKLQELAS